MIIFPHFKDENSCIPSLCNLGVDVYNKWQSQSEAQEINSRESMILTTELSEEWERSNGK